MSRMYAKNLLHKQNLIIIVSRIVRQNMKYFIMEKKNKNDDVICILECLHQHYKK